jgi:hypothetical protein
VIRSAYCRGVGIWHFFRSGLEVALNQLDPAHRMAIAMMYMMLKETTLLKIPESVNPSKLGA